MRKQANCSNQWLLNGIPVWKRDTKAKKEISACSKFSWNNYIVVLQKKYIHLLNMKYFILINIYNEIELRNYYVPCLLSLIIDFWILMRWNTRHKINSNTWIGAALCAIHLITLSLRILVFKQKQLAHRNRLIFSTNQEVRINWSKVEVFEFNDLLNHLLYIK